MFRTVTPAPWLEMSVDALFIFPGRIPTEYSFPRSLWFHYRNFLEMTRYFSGLSKFCRLRKKELGAIVLYIDPLIGDTSACKTVGLSRRLLEFHDEKKAKFER